MRNRRRAGVTLIEMLLALALTASMAAAVGYGFLGGIDFQRAHLQRQNRKDPHAELEKAIRARLEGAVLTEDSADNTTYFVGEASEYGDTGTYGCDTLIFTTDNGTVPMSAISNEDDYETQQNAHGAIGGVWEVELSTQAVGDAGESTGLFVRTQVPADGDDTQGGYEKVLSSEVERIGFRFWDGLEWVDTWDSITGERRLPAAVLVTYKLQGSGEDDVRSFVVAIPASDVDADNPLSGSTST